jgi:hypothetical protein
MNTVRFSRTPFVCPVCGQVLDATDRACPQCGACEKSGWNQSGDWEEWDEPEALEDSARPGRAPSRGATGNFWWWVSLAVLLSFLWLILKQAGL